MPYKLSRIYSNFNKTLTNLNVIVLEFSHEPKNFRRDVIIEGCFLKFVVSWENFVEELFLRCLCGAETRSDALIKPKVSKSANREDAFKRISLHRRGRETEYIDWFDSQKLEFRSRDFFHHLSRVHYIYERPDMLYQVATIRNAIAHGSVNALTKFKKFVIDQVGYLASLNPNIAELLIQVNRRHSKIFFIYYTEYFLALAERLTR